MVMPLFIVVGPEELVVIAPPVALAPIFTDAPEAVASQNTVPAFGLNVCDPVIDRTLLPEAMKSISG